MSSPSTRRRRRALSGAALCALVGAPAALALPAHAGATANEVVHIADADGDGVYSLVLQDLLTRAVTTVLPADPTTPQIYDDPELSPKGDRIALSTDRGAARYEEGIAVVGRDGTGFRRLTSPPAAPSTTYTVDVSPAWSPDGSRLLFTRVTTDTSDSANIRTTTALYTVPSGGGPATAVPNASGGYSGDWSPDGRSIVFAALAPDADSGPLTVLRADGSGRHTIAGAVGLLPAWSPDGSTIAYATVTSRDSDRTRKRDVAQIATVPAAGGTPTVLAPTRPTAARTVAGSPSWSPDGESLLFDLFDHSDTAAFPPGDLWAVDRAGTRAGRVTTSAGDEAQGHAHGPAPSPVSSGAPTTFTAGTPTRVLDTRTGTGGPARKVGPRGTVDLAVRGVATPSGAVPANASAVVLNVTVTGPTAATDVRAYAAGSAVPAVSNLNAGPGETVANLVTARIGTGGGVTLRNSAGAAHLVADVAGWYTPDGAGTGFAAVEPSRILDTRAGVGAPVRRVGALGSLDLTVRGTLPTADGGSVTVPADARAVVLTVTATGATRATDVRVYPASGSAVPVVSNLNLRPGQTAANLVTVAVGRSGAVRLRNLAGGVHLVADLAGYYAPGARGRFVPVAPTRLLDTRNATGAAPIPATASGFVDLRVAGARGIPATATAAVLNLTGTGATAATDVRTYPRGAARVPTVSNLNLGPGETRATLTIVKTGTDGRVRLRTSAGQVHLIGDLAGYMTGG